MSKHANYDLIVEAVANELGLGHPISEFAFAKGIGRKWRFDYAFPHLRLAVEIEGGVWTQGRHTRARGFLADIAKYNAAASMGWVVLRVPAHNLARELRAALSEWQSLSRQFAAARAKAALIPLLSVASEDQRGAAYRLLSLLNDD